MESNSILTGSICLTDIPKELIKQVVCKDGVTRAYLNIAVVSKKSPQTFTNNGVSRTYTHFVSCAPKKEDRKEGVNYIIGDLETRSFNSQPSASAPATSAQMPSQAGGASTDLPF